MSAADRSRRYYDRTPLLAPSVRIRLRMRAWFAAGADRRHGVLDAVDLDSRDLRPTQADQRSELETFFIARNRAEFHQADARDLRATSVVLAPIVERLRRIAEQRIALLGEADELDAELTRLAGRERPRPDALQRGPAEQHASDATVLARREREHDAPTRAAQERLRTIRSRIRALELEAAEPISELEIAFQVQRQRSRMLREHYESCAELYRRRMTHRHPAGAAFQAAAMTTITIPVPAWCDGPNPWIPETFASIGNGNAVEVTR